MSNTDNFVPEELVPEETTGEVTEEFAPQESAPEEPDSDGAASNSESSKSNILNEWNDPELSVPVDKDDERQEVRIRVSSKHLALASRVFKSMLQPGFLIGDKLRSQGYAELSLPDDNPIALLVLLNLVHGRIRKVPGKIDMWMLTELAVLVDKYELLEITEMFLDSWFKNLEISIPQEFNENLLPWMCISWVFNKQEIFMQVTKIAQLESEGPIEECELPIPASVLSKESACILWRQRTKIR